MRTVEIICFFNTVCFPRVTIFRVTARHLHGWGEYIIPCRSPTDVAPPMYVYSWQDPTRNRRQWPCGAHISCGSKIHIWLQYKPTLLLKFAPSLSSTFAAHGGFCQPLNLDFNVLCALHNAHMVVVGGLELPTPSVDEVSEEAKRVGWLAQKKSSDFVCV